MTVVHIITGLGDGGAEAVLYQLVTCDASHNHVVVSLTGSGKYGDALVARNIPVCCLKLYSGAGLAGVVRLWRLLRKTRPDVVQTWMYHADLIGGVIARSAGIRTVYWGLRNSNFDADSIKWSTAAIVRVNRFLSFLVPRRIVSCSEHAMRKHQDLGFAKSRFTVIPNGYDVSRFIPDESAGSEMRRELGFTNEDLVLTMVARFDPQKDHANMLHAAEVARNMGSRFTLLLVGTGMDVKNRQLQKLIHRHQLESAVRLLGRRTDVPQIMNATDVHVLSSMGEAFPNVLAEAMACGTPCVTTRVGDAALIVGDTGWVVPAKDPYSLASAITEALQQRRSDVDGWRIRQAACRDRIVSNFSLEKMIRAYHEEWGQPLAPESVADSPPSTP